MSLADKITLLRKQQGWSQIDLAERLDVSRQSVSKWEMGQAVPELDKIIKLSELFGVTTDYLLKDNGSDSPPPPPEPEPQPQPESSPQDTLPKKKWPWVLAVIVVFLIFLICVLVILCNVYVYDTDTASYVSGVEIDAVLEESP